jgi:predicted transcriptional regulator
MVNLHSSSQAPSLDLTFAALADPTRRGIVATLAGEPRTIAALAEPLPMSLVAVSKHITVLERAGLLTRTGSAARTSAGCGPTRWPAPPAGWPATNPSGRTGSIHWSAT